MVKVTVIPFMVVILAVYVYGNDLLTKIDKEKIRGVRIIGGEDADITQFPHQASLQINNCHHCGASLISSRWLITAGHCTSTFNNTPSSLFGLTVRLGTNLWRTGGQVFPVARIVNHPLFVIEPDLHDSRPAIVDNDISLLYVSQDIPIGPTIQPIRLAEASEVFLPGTICTATGWGQQSEEPGSGSNILQTVNVPLITNEVCESRLIESHNQYTKITATMLCAGFQSGGGSPCHGDSGGPLIAQGLLIGLTSWGDPCCKKNVPAVFTRVQYFREWIRYNSGV